MNGESRGLRGRGGALLAPLRLPAFRNLWAADVISLMGDWVGRLALTVIVLERTGSPGWAAAVTAVSLAGFVGIGQVLATMADRFGRVPVMLVADGVRAACFLAMLADVPVATLLVLAFVAGVVTPPFEAARSAAIPDLVPADCYGDALALAGISFQAAVVIGNLLGGGLLVLVGAETALAVNACTYLVSGLLLLRLRHTAAAEPSGEPRTVAHSLRSGASSLFGDRLIRRAVTIIMVTGALGTVDEALVVPYAERVGISHGMLGVLAAAVPIGTILGTVVIPTTASHERLLRGASLCALVTAGAAAPLFWFEVDSAGAFLAFVISGGMFAVSIPTNVVIGTRLRRGSRASAMGIAVGVLMGSQALGAVAGGAVASTIGPAHAISIALALAAVFSAWAYLTSPQEPRRVDALAAPASTGAGGGPLGGEPSRRRDQAHHPSVVLDG